MRKNRDRAADIVDGRGQIPTVSEEEEIFSTPDQEGAAAVGEETNWNAGPSYDESARKAVEIRRDDSDEDQEST